MTLGDGGQGPLRVGIFAKVGNTREQSGATYYGVMEMSGNLWERCVTLGNSTGRTYSGINGDGLLNSSGDCNVLNWPGSDGLGAGFRGGGWSIFEFIIRVSDRSYAAISPGSFRGIDNGFRCVRSMSEATQSILLPELTTIVGTNITQTTATSGGNITSDGGGTITARGVCWSTGSTPTIADSKTTDGTDTGSYTSSITGLTVNATYYVRAYATNSAGTSYGSAVSFTTKQWTGTVTDIDGNIYHSITIGTQVWMVENLKTTKYRDGSSIPNVTDNTAWAALTTGAYCNYNNDTINAAIYGRLYNWYAVNDSKKIAPTGWHVASDTEWTTLTTYLGGEIVAGGKLKESGLAHWLSPNTGATNEIGFTALPGGYRYYTLGSFFYIGSYGYWWSSTEDDKLYAWFRYMYYNYSYVFSNYFNKSCGFSVRCLRDN